MKISVLIASYKRSKDLERCLRGLEKQSRKADDIVVILRDEDRESWQFIRNFSTSLPLRTLEVKRPGVLAANNLALPTIQSDLISFIDDDACPSTDWLERIEKHFADPTLGALGGRDRFAHPLMLEETERPTKCVGKIRWYGKIVNYHHRVFPFVAEADSLKGCNMTFRRDLIESCDEGLRGNACYYELDLCFGVKAKGYRILFDGNLLVDHYLSENHLDRFRRGEHHPERVFVDYHNRSRVLLKHLHGPRRFVTAIYWLLVEPNLALARFLRQSQTFSCWMQALRGSWAGLLSLTKASGEFDPANASQEALQNSK